MSAQTNTCICPWIYFPSLIRDTNFINSDSLCFKVSHKEVALTQTNLAQSAIGVVSGYRNMRPLSWARKSNSQETQIIASHPFEHYPHTARVTTHSVARCFKSQRQHFFSFARIQPSKFFQILIQQFFWIATIIIPAIPTNLGCLSSVATADEIARMRRLTKEFERLLGTRLEYSKKSVT